MAMPPQPMARRASQLLRQSLIHPHLRPLAEDMLSWAPTAVPPVVVAEAPTLLEALQAIASELSDLPDPAPDIVEPSPIRAPWTPFDLTVVELARFSLLGAYLAALRGLDLPHDQKVLLLIGFLCPWVESWKKR